MAFLSEFLQHNRQYEVCERQQKRVGRRDELLLLSPAQPACGLVRAVVLKRCTALPLAGDKGPLPPLPMCPRSGPLLYSSNADTEANSCILPE